MDIVGKIIDLESGNMTDEDVVTFFQELLDSELAEVLRGLLWSNLRADLIAAGLVNDTHALPAKREQFVKEL